MVLGDLAPFANLPRLKLLEILRSSPILVSELTPMGSLSMAILEAGLIDASLPYRRRWIFDSNKVEDLFLQDEVVFLIQEKESNSGISVENNSAIIQPTQVEILISKSGNQHLGSIDPIVICAWLAAELSPHGVRTRRLLRFSIAGPWFRSERLRWFDPLHSILRDSLVKNGILEVHSAPYWKDLLSCGLHKETFQEIEKLHSSWPNYETKRKMEILSNIVANDLRKNLTPVPRLEVLIWQRPGLPSGECDIFSEFEKWHDEFDRGSIDYDVDRILKS